MCSQHESDWHARDLLDEFAASERELDVAADVTMAGAIRRAWEAGWLPSDLREFARRRLAPSGAAYVAEAVLRECAQYSVTTLHPRWRADLADISAATDPISQWPQMWQWAARHGGRHHEVLTIVLDVLALLGALRPLERLLPVPGEGTHAPTAVNEVDEKVLGKVRALLAKAEATQYSEEAEALSAKAQQLMSRYSLHEAVAYHDHGRAPVAAARRIWIDGPYASAKVVLVQAVATANRCRTVWAGDLGFVTAIGSETDLKLVELLTTSLLVQASRAMLAAGRLARGGDAARTKSFRQSFLVAYATRIGERLDTASERVTTEAREDGRLLPVLVARNRAADELADQLFPSTVRRAVSAANRAGWGAGRAAADLARFDVHDPIAG
jgi:hypothetical protein